MDERGSRHLNCCKGSFRQPVTRCSIKGVSCYLKAFMGWIREFDWRLAGTRAVARKLARGVAAT